MATVTTDAIRKSFSDKDRKYRGITLPNGLRALVCHDLVADQAAAAVSVSVGHLSDPEDLPGLAHYTEHMCFLGSDKYPVENDYKSFLKAHGGGSNASTSTDATTYFFYLRHEHLVGALDRFARFFVAPLMDPSCAEREVNAVNSEHCKNLQSDSRRLYMLQKLWSRPGHVMRKFGTGSIDTLKHIPEAAGIDVRQALLDFHSLHYRAQNMTLVVIGRNPLDELEGLVRDLFSDIKGDDSPKPSFDPVRFSDEELGRVLYLDSVREIRTLKVYFNLPPATGEVKYDHPNAILSHLIGHEGPGSLLSSLKRKGLALKLSAGESEVARTWKEFAVTISLTEEGLSRWQEVVDHLYAYIALLDSAEGVQPSVYEEQAQVYDMRFRFAERNPPVPFVRGTVSLMHRYPVEDVLAAPSLLACKDMDAVVAEANAHLALCVPTNSRIVVHSKHSVDTLAPSLTPEVEPIYSGRHAYAKIDEDTLARWTSLRGLGSDGVGEVGRLPAPFDDLHLPPPNVYIPTDFSISHSPAEGGVEKPAEAKEEDCDEEGEGAGSPATPKQVFPVPDLVVADSPFYRVWHKQDTTFLLPKSTVTAQVLLPASLLLSDRNAVIHDLFTRCFTDDSTELLYAPSLANLHVRLQTVSRGLRLVVTGFSHKLGLLTQDALKMLLAYEPTEEVFARQKDQYLRLVRNIRQSQPRDLAAREIRYALHPDAVHYTKLLEAADSVTLEDVLRWKADAFASTFTEIVVYGNYNRTDAKLLGSSAAQLMASASSKGPLDPMTEPYPNDCVALPAGVDWRLELEHPEPNEKNSAVRTSFYIGPYIGAESQAEARILARLINEPFFHQLRTTEQLGYMAHSNYSVTRNALWVNLSVQSDVSSVEYVDGRMDAFLYRLLREATEMSEEDFNVKIQTLHDQLLETSKAMYEENGVIAGPVLACRYEFGRSELVAAEILSYLNRKSDIIALIREKLLPGGKQRRKISSWVRSQTMDETASKPAKATPVMVQSGAGAGQVVIHRPVSHVRASMSSEEFTALEWSGVVDKEFIPPIVSIFSAAELGETIPQRVRGWTPKELPAVATDE